MERTLIGELHNHIGESVVIKGWLDVRRDQGKIVFLNIRDRSGVVQAVVLPGSPAAGAAKEVRSEWVLALEGTLNKRPEKMINAKEKNGDIELEVKSISVLSKTEDLPFELGTEVNIDTYLDHLPYTLRASRAKEVFAVQATLIEAFRSSLRNEYFTEFQAPALVGGDAEGGAAAFKVGYYYDQTAYLATSPQLYKQIMVGVFERVFATPKVFRGEKHATTRHLSEYSSLDFEMGFIKDHTDVMALLERTICNILTAVDECHEGVYERFLVERPLLPKTFPTLKLREAQEILEREFGVRAVGEPDLEPEHERLISEWAKREHTSDFIFITHYPLSKRPFYTYEDETDKGFTKSFDLLFRGLEITTGGQRVHDYKELVAKIVSRGLRPEQFSFYLEAFKSGMPPHGGSATGLERFTARLLGLHNVKEATLFPRDITRIDVRLTDTHKE